MLMPSTQMTKKVSTGKAGLKVQLKSITVISSSTSQRPRLTKNAESCALVFRRPAR